MCMMTMHLSQLALSVLYKKSSNKSNNNTDTIRMNERIVCSTTELGSS
jgi:hypothetical protein